MKLPILKGVYTNNASDVRTAYPHNIEVIAMETGVDTSYLRQTKGIEYLTEAPGPDRGGINWNEICYRVSGSKLISVSQAGLITILGDVEDNGLPVSLDYSFTLLCIVSNKKVFYFDGSVITQLTDPDLGQIIDVVFMSSFFLFTDGNSLITTDINDPYSISPFNYGSSEADPDPVVALKKIRNEAYAVNRYTCELFDVIGGEFFPLQRIEGAQLQKGAVGTKACTVFSDVLAFVGSGRNEAVSVYMGINSETVPVSTREIDQIIQSHTTNDLTLCIVENRFSEGQQLLYIHLPRITLLYDAAASKMMQTPVWTILSSGENYRARFFTRCYDLWLLGDTITNNIGFLIEDSSKQWGLNIQWEFSTVILYNDGMGVIVHQLELAGLYGRVDSADTDPVISASYSLDGESWSYEQFIRAGKVGARNKRLVWLRQGQFRNFRIYRFRGDSKSLVTVLRLEAKLEPLSA